jgi:hypothetical protein
MIVFLRDRPTHEEIIRDKSLLSFANKKICIRVRGDVCKLRQ